MNIQDIPNADKFILPSKHKGMLAQDLALIGR